MVGNGDDDEVDSGWDADAAAHLRAADDDAPEITIEEVESMPPSTVGPVSIGRRNTPRVMDAVVQARELDHTAAKQMALRKTPVRIPSAAKKSSVPPGATSSVPPAPTGTKAKSTAIRFADPPPAPRPPPARFDRKATVRLSPATHKLAFDLAAEEDPIVPPAPDSETSTAEGLVLDVTLSGLDDLAVSLPPPGSGDAFDDLPIDAVLDSHRSGIPPTNILATRKRLADLADAIEQRERGLDPPRPLGSITSAPAAPVAPSSPPRSGGELDLALDMPVSSEPVALDDADISSFPPGPPPAPEARARGAISDLKMAPPLEIDADKFIDAIAREESGPPPSPGQPYAVAPTLEPPPGLAPEVEGRLEAARLRFDKGDFAGALLRIEPLAEEHPDCKEAVELLGSCRDAVKRTYLEKLGSETSVPRVIMPPGEIQALAFDHRSGFLISLIDGNACVDEILDMSGMPPLEALRLLFELQQEGVIESAGEPRAEGGRPRRPG